MSTPDDETFDTLARRADDLTLKNRAMEEAPFGITIADVSRDDQPLVYANSGFQELTGYGREEVLGRNCRFLQGERTDPEPVAKMRGAIESRTSVQVVLRNYRADGTAFWNEVTLAPVPDDDGRIRYYVGFQQDVTDRQEYARRLKDQRDNLEILHQLVRHDVRNDLQLVLASVEMLKDHVDADGRDHVDAVLESAHHAVDLTQTAREMAEVMLQGETDNEPVALAPVLEGELEEITAAYPDAEIALEGELPRVKVLADGMLPSVFRNLLKNAIRHNDKSVPEVRVSATASGNTVTVRVADNGPGVPEDLKGEIFGKGKTFGEEGTGIGLYLVRTLVEGYGGDVWVEGSGADRREAPGKASGEAASSEVDRRETSDERAGAKRHASSENDGREVSGSANGEAVSSEVDRRETSRDLGGAVFVVELPTAG